MAAVQRRGARRKRSSGARLRLLHLVIVLERHLLGGVHRAQVRVSGVERRADLSLGEGRAALGASALDYGVDAVRLEVHGRDYTPQASSLDSLAVTCSTGLPVTRSTRCGRSRRSHLDTCLGRVDTTISSNSLKLTASSTAATGSGSP